MKEHAIASRLLYRLIKKHIAGTTMSSAIEKAKELNDRKLPVSIGFLSDAASDSTKARYATTTYLELIRRIARMGLKASIQVPLSQVGFAISNGITSKNVGEILSTAKRHGVFVWFEVQNHGAAIPGFLRDAKGVGYAIGYDIADSYLRSNRGEIKALKILCTGMRADKKEESRGATSRISNAAKSVRNAVLQSAPEAVLRQLLNGSASRKSLIFEFQLGYSNRGISKIMKRGARASVYVPFGKDWEGYAATRAPESYARFLAARILREGTE